MSYPPVPGPVPEPAEIPDLAEIRHWLGVDESDLDEGELGRIYRAELGLQVQYNRTEPYTDWLAMALFRRCARAAAAKGLPLGTLPAQMTGWPDAYGVPPTGVSGGVIPRLDSEIERYEGPSRVIAFA
jgi:hypothetical protein